jgi:radical SAM protein with 4Fe4S-binding SPASM domain
MSKGWERSYQRKSSVRLRRTPFGGAAFLPEKTATVELDDEAFSVLCWLAFPLETRELRRRFVEHFDRNITLADLERVIRPLQDYGFITQVQGEPNSSLTSLAGIPSDPQTVPIAPESVHLQLNNICNLRCPSCYISLQSNDEGSLPYERLMRLVDELAELGVFQLALGGGEPLMSPYFLPIIQYVQQQNALCCNVTTNGWLLTEWLVAQIRDALGEVRLSLNDAASICHDMLEEKAALLREEDIPFGFNIIVTRRNIRKIEEIVRWLVALRPCTVTLVRPKPAPHNGRWYAANALSAQDSLILLRKIECLEPLFAETQLTVDCAFSYLFHDMTEAELTARGVSGCAMGERFVYIAWNGDVYPCSHLQDANFKIGNIIEQPFRAIWEKSQFLSRLWINRNHLRERCVRCAKRQFCGGCRAIAWRTTGDLQAEDSDCPFNFLHSA